MDMLKMTRAQIAGEVFELSRHPALGALDASALASEIMSEIERSSGLPEHVRGALIGTAAILVKHCRDEESESLHHEETASAEQSDLRCIALAAELLMGLGQNLVIPPEDATPGGAKLARAYVDGMLAAAKAGGYMQCDILETMLAKCDITDRLRMMAQCACEAAGEDAIMKVIRALKGNL
jgi:hypothetical protein